MELHGRAGQEHGHYDDFLFSYSSAVTSVPGFMVVCGMHMFEHIHVHILVQAPWPYVTLLVVLIIL